MAENYILLERIELNASVANVIFANIPQSGYTDLKMVMSARTNGASHSWNYKITFNGASTNYSGKVLYGSGSAAASFNANTTYFDGIYTSGSTATANTFGSAEMYIPNYTSSNNKSVSTDSAAETNGTAAFMAFQAGLYSSSSAITSIKIEPEPAATAFEAYSTFSLYGLAAVGTTPVIAPKASGGNIIDFDGTYWIHTFTSSGTFTPFTNLTCDYLVVAGGGGGGNAYTSATSGTGGGGAGGLRSTVTATGGGGSLESALSLTAQNYTVTIGAGGPDGGTSPQKGSNSVFSTVTSEGGGSGAYIDAIPTYNGQTGGSGGGGANSGTGGSGTANQGYAGGASGSFGQYGGAGGGAGGAGLAGGSGVPRAGGAGLAVSISGSSVTYAVGGANNGSVNGTANRGTGGGGGYGGVSSQVGGAGGSGIVIIRYLA
jgi:hypothetical protein